MTEAIFRSGNAPAPEADSSSGGRSETEARSSDSGGNLQLVHEPKEPALRPDVLRQVEEACAGVENKNALAWIELEGPEVEPRRLLSLLGDSRRADQVDAFVWETSDESWAGWGIADEIRADGPSRFTDVRSAAEERLIEPVAPRSDSPIEPRWFGGFSFESHLTGEVLKSLSEATSRGRPGPDWSSFGEASFVLPKISVRRQGDKTAWFLVLTETERANAREQESLKILSSLWDSLESEGPGSEGSNGSSAVSVHSSHSPHFDRDGDGGSEQLRNGSGSVGHRGLSGDRVELRSRSEEKVNGFDFASKIEEVGELIRTGRAQKVVAADQRVLSLAESPDLERILSAWSESAAESTRFLFRRSGDAFLGATPERLVRQDGTHIRSSALAGTVPKPSTSNEDLLGDSASAKAGIARKSGTEGTETAATSRSHAKRSDSEPPLETLESALMGNPKEQREHQYVVGHLAEVLAEVCSSVEVADKPEVLELRDLLHLMTPVTAILAEPMHILDLVEKLHPTPAVCGLPCDVAIQWIRDHEVASRGWYSGPIGWFDSEGNGDFHVALRSMLISSVDDQEWNAARLFAGVGLVAGSEVGSEQREVAAKLLTAERALADSMENSSSIEARPEGELD